MANSITDCRNSFITFNNELFLTDRDCAIVKPFCLPIFSPNDIAFQFILNTDDAIEDLTDIRIRTISNGTYHNLDITKYTVNKYELEVGMYLINISFNSTSDMLSPYNIGGCFQLVFSRFFDGEPFYSKTSVQCLQIIGDNCFTSKVQYQNIEDAFGFYYANNYINSIRLPIYFKNPVIQNDQKVYVRSNGTRQKLYAKLAKKWLGLVDMATEEVHQKLVVALSHDFITFTTDNGYLLECTFEDEYNPDFPDVMQGINVWTANFNVMETPFDEVNNNCG